MPIYAYRKNKFNEEKKFHVFKIDLKEDETEYSFFTDYVPADDARDMVEDETELTGEGFVYLLLTKDVPKRKRKVKP